jgi:hypothetical protein
MMTAVLILHLATLRAVRGISEAGVGAAPGA